jgi:carboxyl-terminal processing protease
MTEKKFSIQPYIPVFLSLALVAGIFIGNYIAKRSITKPKYLIYPGNTKINEAFYHIEKEYVDSVDTDKLTEAAIYAMLDSLDPHTQYFPKLIHKKVSEPLKGEFSGIGIQFNMQNDTVVVIQTIANGPSEKAGLLPGDRIVLIDGENVAGVNMPTDDIVGKLKGRKGTEVTVSILRRTYKKMVDFILVRDDIPLYSVDSKYMLSPQIGYIKINGFSLRTYDEFINATDYLIKKGMKKMVLDLRGNGGGNLMAAVNLVDEFLPKGRLIVYTKGKAYPRQEYKSRIEGTLMDIDLVVLIDEMSASASEIVAGALQDNDRAVIIGKRSFGKGLVLNDVMLKDSSVIRLSIARFYTPSGRYIQKPYINGREEYDKEIFHRYETGEVYDKDSIKYPDSLQYYTYKGRVVYGGGGITPDIFVPRDTAEYTQYFTDIWANSLFYKFSFDYVDANRQTMNKMNTIGQIEQYLDRHNILMEFIRYAEKEGIERNPDQFNTSVRLIDTYLKAHIARNLLDNEGFYPILHRIDNTLEKAVKVLEAETLTRIIHKKI